jgi:ABC-type transport system involved in cytochrome bd biosynthesis fused ATPase/permease subunit
MVRVSTIFIAICMVLIAASFGLILYAMTGLSLQESAIVALAALICLIFYNAISMRIRGRTEANSQIADLSRGTADLARHGADRNQTRQRRQRRAGPRPLDDRGDRRAWPHDQASRRIGCDP